MQLVLDFIKDLLPNESKKKKDPFKYKNGRKEKRVRAQARKDLAQKESQLSIRE